MNLADYINTMSTPKDADYWKEYLSDDYGLVDIHVLHDSEGLVINAYPIGKGIDTSVVLYTLTKEQ